ncbi:hypothetical protein JSY14_00030 [Brachybacterium sp. EF45031]|uniref:hypothetical protein n=1 Tax=Brachybacterium sillae TaxID=2810536 RepID=UPI00217EA916|nr:hypothetical protein [Brachybacterium sillae]MCS6710479.1 hypothetical protein [Brachybacterium sillae]
MINRGTRWQDEGDRRLFGVFPSEEARRTALAWARDILTERRVDPRTRPVQAIRELRRREPLLDLIAARRLVELVAEDAGTDAGEWSAATAVGGQDEPSPGHDPARAVRSRERRRRVRDIVRRNGLLR